MSTGKDKENKGLGAKIRAKFFPDKIVASIKSINFSDLKTAGLKLILVDIDNTMALHGAKTADRWAIQVAHTILEHGLELCVCSNASPERALLFANSLNSACLPAARKPNPQRILEYIAQHGYQPREVILIGDQLITDVLAARRAGITVFLSRPLRPREIFTVRLKRPLEKLLVLLGGKKKFNSLEEKTHDRL